MSHSCILGSAKSERGFTLTEILISIALLAIISVSVTQAFLVLNRRSTLSRIGTAALAAAQQEIDLVLAVRPFNTNAAIPQILRVQSEGGTLASGESVVTNGTDGSGRAFTMIIRPVSLAVSAMKATGVVQGMLLRKVTVISTTLRQIDVQVGYNYNGGTNSASYTYTTQSAFETAYRYQVRTSTFRSIDE